ncbi:replication initiation protein, partial [Pantoea agglomerans]
ATLLSRREKASRNKHRSQLGKLSLDDRRNAMAKLLRMRPANEWMKLPPDEFDRLVWKSLRQLDLGLDYEPASPIPDQVH